MGSQGRGRGTQHVICRLRGEHGMGPVCGPVLEREVQVWVEVYLPPKYVSITYCFVVGVFISLAHGLLPCDSVRRRNE